MAKTKQQKETPTDAEQLATALGSIKREVAIGGETVIVHKFKFRDIGAVLDSVQELSGRLRGEMDAEDALGIASRFPDIAARWISYATDKPLEWVGNQDHEEICGLLGAVVEVNRRFFTGETLTPMYEVIGQALTPTAPITTSASSAPSSAPDGLSLASSN